MNYFSPAFWTSNVPIYWAKSITALSYVVYINNHRTDTFLQMHDTIWLLHTCQPFCLKESWGRTLDWTSALWSFWRSRAADLVSSFRAAMCKAGRRTLPLVSFSRRMETTWLWPCWRAMARGVKPSWKRKTVVYPWHAAGLKREGPISHYIHHFMFDDKYWQDHHKSYIQTLIPRWWLLMTSVVP